MCLSAVLSVLWLVLTDGSDRRPTTVHNDGCCSLSPLQNIIQMVKLKGWNGQGMQHATCNMCRRDERYQSWREGPLARLAYMECSVQVDLNIGWKDANFGILIALFLLRSGVFWDLMLCSLSHLRILECSEFCCPWTVKSGRLLWTDNEC